MEDLLPCLWSNLPNANKTDRIIQKPILDQCIQHWCIAEAHKKRRFFKKAGKCHPQVNCYLGRVLLFDGDYRDALRAGSRDSMEWCVSDVIVCKYHSFWMESNENTKRKCL